MKTILCPTDFSAASENAIRYAFEINKKLKVKIILFHSYFIPVPATDIPVLIPEHLDSAKKSMNALEKLKKKMEQSYPSSQFEIELLIAEGNPLTEIKSNAENKNADIIIMGTKGASGIRKALVGSNTANAIAIADRPVIAVPEHSTFHPIHKILFATNYTEGDFMNVERVIELARPFDAEVILLHIGSHKFDITVQFDAIERFKQRISEESGYSRVSFKLLEGVNLEESILIYLDEIKADLLAMTNRHRSFFEKLFKKSLTKKIANVTRIPLLAFHEMETEYASKY